MNRRQAFLNSLRPTSETRYTVLTQHNHRREEAFGGGCLLRRLAARAVALSRIDAVLLATEPMDMRPGTDTELACVVKIFGVARYNHFAKQIYRASNLCRKPSLRSMS